MRTIKPGGEPQIIDSVTRFIKGWRPVDAYLIEDKVGEFVIPTEHSRLGADFCVAYRHQSRKHALITCSLAFIASLLLYLEPSVIELGAGLALIFVLLFSTLDSLLGGATNENCRARVEFCFYLNRAFKNNAKTFLPFFVAIYALQLGVTWFIGSTDALIIGLGNYFPNIQIDSIWRFLTGPWIHADIKHWIMNLLLTLMAAATIPTNKVSSLFGVFVIGAVGSHVIRYGMSFMMLSDTDALVGASGGTFALLGFSCMYRLIDKRQNCLVLTLAGFLICSAGAAALMTDNVSTIAHVSGFLLGVLCYPLVRHSILKKQFERML